MFSRHRRFGLVVACLMLLLTPGAPARQAALGTDFTYQGMLKENGQPVNGVVDLQFTLFDALAGGSQSSPTQFVNAVPVTDGVFTVQLDFGGDAFDGQSRWLEIGVASPAGGGVGPFTGLTPRQALVATPYALFALKTNIAGAFASQVAFGNLANTFNGSFTGDGGGLTNIHPGTLTAGTANIDITGTAAIALVANTANGFNGQLPVINGGTGGNDPTSARANIDAAQRGVNGDITALTALTQTIAVFQGGTGASDITTARANLGAAKSGVNGDITALTALATPLSLAQGGTGAGNALVARGNLGAAGLADANIFSRAQEINLTANEAGLSIRAAPAQAVNLQQWRNSSGTIVSSVSAAGVFSGNGSGLVNLDATGIVTGTLPNGRLAGTYGNQLLLTNPNNFITGIASGITNLDASSLASGTMPMARMPTGGAWNIAGLTVNGSSSTTTINSNIIDVNGELRLDQPPTMPATTRTVALSAAAFTPLNNTMTFSNAGTGLSGTTAGQLVTFIAPLNLPDDAIISEVRFYVLDNDGSQNITVAQLARALDSTTPVISGTGGSSGGSAIAQQVTVTPFPGPIDNTSTAFWLSTTWTVPATPANIRVLGARVTYTITTPLP